MVYSIWFCSFIQNHGELSDIFPWGGSSSIKLTILILLKLNDWHITKNYIARPDALTFYFLIFFRIFNSKLKFMSWDKFPVYVVVGLTYTHVHAYCMFNQV